MNSVKNLSKYFIILAVSFCLFALGLCGISVKNEKAFAEDFGTVPSYFKATDGTDSFERGSTVLLNVGESLNITLGKPAVVGEEFIGEDKAYTDQNFIGNYGLDFLNLSPSLSINGNQVTNLDEFYDIVSFKYITPITLVEKTFSYFEMNIDLAEKTQGGVYKYPSGEYVLTFNAYNEYSGTNFETASTNITGFSVTFYVFSTSEYFTDDSGVKQKTTFENVVTSTPLGSLYRNYYFFNYSNYTKSFTDANYLPSLTFDANKFSVNITKSYSGLQKSCTVNNFTSNTDIITLTGNTTDNFITAKYNNDGTITIYFQDIGDYKISYDFYFKNNNGERIKLQNNQILNFQEKSDILYIYGYQMFFSGTALTGNSNEFKLVDQNGQTSGKNSADVSYMLSYEDLLNARNVGFEEDSGFLANILSKAPASTNQPAITTTTNASIITERSYFYKLDALTLDWAKNGDAYIRTPYQDNAFTSTGTYLLKVVYSFNNYDNSTYFTQFFYFKISNSSPSLIVEEVLEDQSTNILGTNSFTKNSVRITLEAQSVFNSPVRFILSAKSFGSNAYSTVVTTQSGQIDTKTIFEIDKNTINYNRNYKLELVYGVNDKNNSTTYFTIDDTAFEQDQIKILPALQSSSTSLYYSKDTANPVEFFTRSNVVVEWKEKDSGAKSFAYYKYIPFKKLSGEINRATYDAYNAIATDYGLDFSENELLTMGGYSNTKNMTQIKSDVVLSNQGFYIVYIVDEAGNEEYVSFCIDRTNITIWQIANNTYQTNLNLNNNIVATNTTLKWGRYKLIALGIETLNVADSWVKNALTELNNTPDIDQDGENYDDSNLININGSYFFAVEINKAFVLQTGLEKEIYNDKSKTSDTIIFLDKNEELNYEYAKELTYVYYLIDESNSFFNKLTGSNLESSSFADQIIQNASLAYKITTSSDSANANILINTSATDEVSQISSSSAGLSVAGFTDSSTNLSTDAIDLRSKYYFTTGDTIQHEVTLLTYLYQKNEGTATEVGSIEVFYYPFEVKNGVYTLSDTAIKLTHIGQELAGDYAGYTAFNLNPEYDVASGMYKTKEGKYIIVRTYLSASGIQDYDFFVRESVVIVDRQDIVSNPVETDNGYKSLVGGDIFVNLLDGYAESDGAVRFESIYSAKNNETYVMQTNKLPVVVYVPISKYGATIYDGNNYLFNANQTLGKFFNISQDAQDMEIYYLERYNTAEGNTKSRLMLSYFGENNILTSGFENTSSYLNPSFDLTIKITDNKGKTTSSALNQSFASNYWVSNNITEAGIYTVEIIQNATYGSVYPNIYKTFKFTFEIIEKPPVFDFVDVATGDKFASDNNGVYYSNKSSVRVEWADPTSIYLAEIDKGNIYYTINGIRKNIAISDIQTTDNKNFSFTINNLKNKDIVVVHMQYLGAQSANSYLNQELIIDTEAPTTVLNTLISATGLKDNNNFTSQIRNVDATYNITGFTGYLAYYYFTVGHNVAYLNNLLSQKASVNGYFTDGNKYYIKLISDINSYEISSVAEALNKVNAINTDYNVIPGAMMSGRYYEVLELDLAGNLSLYTIKVVATNPYDIVVSYDKEETDYNSDFELTYQELSNNSNIFAKGKFVATSLDLYENDWLFFTINDTTYFKSPNLDENEFYNFSKWTNLSLQPQIATLEDIMSFENAGKNVLTITDTAFPNGTNAKVCTVNIYVTKTELTSSLLSVDEGIRITGNNYQYPVSMKIYSYINNRYQLIYDKTTFTSTQEITFSSGSTSYTFTVVNPENAYKYEFVDNFGISYVDYHTVGVEKLPEDQIVQNHITTHEITSDGDTNTWYIGFDDLTYNYNASEYNAFIRVYYLAFNQTLQKVEWKEYIYPDGNIDPVLGCELVSGVSTPYFKVTNTKTINHIEVFAQDSISKFSGYSGNAIKAVITLKNQKDSSSSDVIVDHLLINNIIPEVRLTDNNGQDKSALLDGNSLYSGQITILYDLKNFDNEFIFPYSFGLIYNNNEEEPLESGERIADAGTYIINIYTTIDSQRYLINSHSILIEPSEDFYNVVVFDDTANMYVDVLPTGEVFEDENTGIVCYKHFIVRTEQYKINVSENDEILDPMNPANASTCIVSKISSANNTYYTIIYLITNSQSTSLDIRPCHFHIAITYIPPSTVLFESVFGYDIDSDGQLLTLAGASDKISISEMDQNFVELTISYNSYYLVEENKITPTIYFGDNLDMLYEPTITEVNGVSTFSLKFNGLYLLSFKDIAGNVHLFTDSITGNRVNAYRLIYVNGVAFDINGKTPIENAIYDNEVLITLPDYLNEVYTYDVGGSPKIAVTKNGKAIEVAYNSEKGGYVISGAGYYSVYFDAMIDGKATRKVVYNFNIIATDEFKTDFNFAQYGEYEIIEVKKDGRVVDYSGLFPHDVDTKHLKSINLSINDEMTGEGKYQITVATNSGLKNILQGGNEEETFTFNLIIKHIGYVPIEISINEGESTTDKIKISFNASDVFNSVGECVIICGNTIYEINEAYVNSLKADGSSFQTCEIAETGTHFVQVYSSSGKLLYSYKVIKTEPLNAVSIILIVVSVLAVAGLVITVTLLRKRMKIR